MFPHAMFAVYAGPRPRCRKSRGALILRAGLSTGPKRDPQGITESRTRRLDG